MELDRRVCDRARKSRDARFDGKFFIAVTSTRIYCRPICPARSPKNENIRYYPSAAAAEAAGFRPCLRCRPEASPATPAWFGTSSVVSRALQLIRAGALDREGVEALADRLGVTELRRRVRQQDADPDCYRFRLAYRPPYDWSAMQAFLAARATPGVESVQANRYERTIAIAGKVGSIAITPVDNSPALMLEVRIADPRSLLTIVERVRRMFDIGADPAVVAEQLSGEPILKRTLVAHAGIRVPGAWDPFELTVRAILGQQISVRGATTIAGRVAERWGAPFVGSQALTRLFPTPAELADARFEDAGITGSRSATLRSLARLVRNGGVTFDGADPLVALGAIAGIGDWTTQYVAMRALNEPDAFPSGDLVLRHMAGDCTARELERRSQAWRPWRAYAVLLLWQAARDRDERTRRTRHAQRPGAVDDVERRLHPVGAALQRQAV